MIYLERKAINRNIPFALILLSSIIHFICINYGRPFHIHPDESYIYEDPLKVLLNYSHFKFTSEWNLSMISIVLWTPLVFIFGYVSAYWSSFAEFKLSLIGQDFNVLYLYRILSVVFLFSGNILLYKIIKENIKSIFLEVFVLSLVLFNSLILGTNLFIKMDSIAYFAVICAYYYLNKNYSADSKKIHPRVLPILSLLACARIDIAAIFGMVFLFIFFDSRKQKEELFLSFKYFLFSIVVYLILTLKPLVLIYRYLHPNYITETWDSFDVIFFQSVLSVINGQATHPFLDKFLTINMESLQILFLLCPTVLLLFIFKPRGKIGIMFFLSGIIFLVLIAVIGVSDFPRHRTMPYLMIYFSMLSGLSVVRFVKLNKMVSIVILAFQILPFIFMVYEIGKPNTYKKELTDYILRNTTEKDTIAHGSYGIAGYSMDLLSSSSYYEQLSKAAKESGAGTGEKALYLSRLKNVPRRTIIPVLQYHLFATTSAGDPRTNNLFLSEKDISTSKYANKLSFAFSDCSPQFKNAKYYISRNCSEPECVKEYFSFDTTFSPHQMMAPYGVIINNMLFKEKFYIWKNKSAQNNI